MPTPHAEKLIELAHKGQKLGTKDRRHCVAFLMASQPDTTNVAMGELFKVSERQIRLDKKYIREEKAKLIKEDDISLVIADIVMTLDRQMRDIEAGKKKCAVGSRTYLDHCKAVHELQLKTVKALQDLGYYPKNLGNMTIDKYEYRAVVSEDGSVDTRPVNLIIEDEEEERRQKVIEAEFEAVPTKPVKALPGASDDTPPV